MANADKIIYIVFVTGLLIWQYPVFFSVYFTVKNRIRITRNLRSLTESYELKKHNAVIEWSEKLIRAAGFKKYIKNPENLWIASGVLGAGAFLIVSAKEEFLISMISSVFAFFLLPAVVCAGLRNRRVANSREGDILVQEMLNNYRIYNFNIREAIEMTSVQICNAPNSKRILLDLAKGISGAVTEKEVRDVLDSFKFSIDTSWGNVLASNIYFAYVEGIRIDSALEDLALTMSQRRKVAEHEKRENNEARLILNYLSPACLLLTVAGACRFFDFTVSKYLYYQFGTSTGLKWFIIMTICYITGIIVNGLLSKEKMDI